jgi:hypothetical protein
MTFKRKDKPLTTEDIGDIFMKVDSVIYSCKTQKHLWTAIIFRNRAYKYIKKKGISHLGCCGDLSVLEWMKITRSSIEYNQRELCLNE